MSWPGGGPGTAVAGTTITASFWNTNGRDALNALVAGYSEITSLAAGDLLYALTATQLARVAASGNALKFLRMNAGETAPEFVDIDPLTLATDAPGTPVADTLYANTIVKGWVIYNGVTNSVLASANVDSVTDHGTGDYTINWTTDFADANYAVVGMADNDGGAGSSVASEAIAAGSVRINVYTHSGGATAKKDLTPVFVMAIGAQ